MSRIRLYFDEDAMQQALVAVLTASDAGMINRSDEDHLRWAAREERVLYSFNIADYCSLHRQWLERGEAHSGIVLAPQQRYSVGEQLRRLLYLLSKRPAGEMRSRLEYLSGWGGVDLRLL